MSAPYYTGQSSASGSPYRPGTAESSWHQGRPPTYGGPRPEMYSHLPAGAAPSQFRPEPLQPTQQSALGGAQVGVYLGPNVVTPRQSAFPREPVDSSSHFGATAPLDDFGHSAQSIMPTDTPRAASMGANPTFDASKMAVGAQHTFSSATASTWPAAMQQQQSDPIGYSRYAYPTQAGTSSWHAGGELQNVVYDTSSSSTNANLSRSQPYYEMSSDHFDYGSYPSHMGTHSYPLYGPSTSKVAGSTAYMAATQTEYQPEEIDSMLNQVSTLYKTANTKKMAEFYRDKWARMWLTCNYTLKPSIQISIPRTILHESYRRACDSFGLEPLQAASFGKVLRSQYPDVAQRRLGGRGKTRFHYCGFGTSNEREASKVKSLLEDERAGRLQLSAGLSAEYASEARSKGQSEGHDSQSSYRNQASSEASPVEGHPTRSAQYNQSPHTSSETSALGGAGIATDDRLIASAFATLNSAVLTPPGTSSSNPNSCQEATRYPQNPSQVPTHVHQSSNSGSAAMPRRHTVSHSYSGLSDLSFLPGMASGSEAHDTNLMHSGDVSSFGPGSVSGISEPPQSASLLNSPASSLHGYQYIQDPRHVPSASSIPFRRSCQDLPDWPTLPDNSNNPHSTSTYAVPAASTDATTATGTHASQESRKAWREYESLCQALLYSIHLGPDPVSFEQRTISFWSNLAAATRDALRSEAVLHGMIFRADGIIFRQLLVKLDGMIGDDVADERMSGLMSLARMLAEQMEGLVKDALPEACSLAKVQASQKMAESLERIVKIFEAIKAFREESMLDGTAEPSVGGNSAEAEPSLVASQPFFASSNPVTPHTASTLSLGLRNPSIASAIRAGHRPRSDTQGSLGSIPGHLAWFQSRRRDHSISSTLSDSQSTLASGDHAGAASSASESELPSTHVEGIPKNFYAPLARKATTTSNSSGSNRSRVASDGGGGISHTLGGLALAELGAGGESQLATAISALGTTQAETGPATWWPQPKAEMQD